MKEIEAIVKQFENFIKRVLLPSSSFIVFFVVYDVYLNEHRILDYLNKIESSILVMILIVGFAGLSTVLSIITQAIYDNRLKGNFDAKLIFTKENETLKRLREKLIATLKNGESNDYILYQTIVENKDDTHRYTTQAKEVGIVFSSLLVVMVISAISLVTSFYIGSMIILFLLGPVYLLGRELVKSRYRSRAIRIYINYLKADTKE